MLTIVKQIEADCAILLRRALVSHVVSAFGDDGCGKHGRSSTPVFYTISSVEVELEADDDDSPSVLTGKAWIFLQGYDADKVGYILTDKNFEISIRQLLIAESILPDALTWADIGDQGERTVAMSVDVEKLLRY